MLFATAGTMTVNTYVLKLVKVLGSGEQYDQAGWTKTYIILGLATRVICCRAVKAGHHKIHDKKIYHHKKPVFIRKQAFQP